VRVVFGGYVARDLGLCSYELVERFVVRHVSSLIMLYVIYLYSDIILTSIPMAMKLDNLTSLN
jgi:hypothetical protein